MRLLLVQLSDIHFRKTSNPVAARASSIAAAIRSVGATPDACFVLATGDVAMTGQSEEYVVANKFFSDIRAELEHDFPGALIEFFFIPGNHDCFLPEETTALRKVIVAAAADAGSGSKPDPGISVELLSVQDGFFNFAATLGTNPVTWQEKICSHKSVVHHGKTIRVNLFNTAFLSQRHEEQSLSLPLTLLESSILPDSSADLTIALHHHSEGWLEANFKRAFRKLIETTSDIVFTGHEHQSDYHLTQNADGNSITYVEGDVLQELGNFQRSGFNCLLLDLDERKQSYFLFRWKNDKYTAIVDGAEHPLRTIPKGGAHFRFSDQYLSRLVEDDFGFRHDHKPRLLLEDIFVYPSVTHPIGNKRQEAIQGDQLLDRVLNDRYVLFYGPDRSGKSALLKTLQKDIFSSTAIVPVKLDGKDITAQSEDTFLKRIWSYVGQQYADDCVENFRQLPRERRALLIDNLDLSHLQSEKVVQLLEGIKKYFGCIVASVSTLLGSVHLYVPQKTSSPDGLPLLQLFVLGEMRPAARGKLIKKWLSVETSLAGDPEALSRAIETEENMIDFLIGKHVLPSLPYLVLGVLQARQHGKEDLLDPGSFGYIVQRIVIDALSASQGRQPMIERKDYLLRTLAFYLFQHEQTQVSEQEFESIVADFAHSKMTNVNGKELLDDLLYGRILEKVDGYIQFRYEHFQYYFLALKFIDEIDGENTVEFRQYLNAMADKPLAKHHKLTLIFFLFFKKKDPIIDRLIDLADATFYGHAEASLQSDAPSDSTASLAFVSASLDENVNVAQEREKRWSQQESVEKQTSEAQEWNANESGLRTRPSSSLEIAYEEAASDEQRWEFAEARLALLGQIIRNFPDSLDGTRKVQILNAAIRLGLRSLQAGLDMIHAIDTQIEGAIRQAASSQGVNSDGVEQVVKLWKLLVGVVTRLGVNVSILGISRAVGVQDLEKAYSKAIDEIGETPATRLVELAIMLDHGKTFPFVEAQRLSRYIPTDARLAKAVMSDLVVRNTKRFDHSRDALRRIAGLINVAPTSLLPPGGTT